MIFISSLHNSLVDELNGVGESQLCDIIVRPCCLLVTGCMLYLGTFSQLSSITADVRDGAGEGQNSSLSFGVMGLKSVAI